MRHILIAFAVLLSFSTAAQVPNADDEAARVAALAEDWYGALNHINDALRSDSVNADFLMDKAEYLTKLKRYNEADKVITDAIRTNPRNPWIYSNRGNMLLSYGKIDSAIADFNKALSLATHDSMRLIFYLNRAAAGLSHRDFQGAYSDLMKAYRIDSNNVGVLVNLANACDETGRGSASIGYLKRAIAIDPGFVPAYANLGFKYQDLNDHKTALSYYNKVIEMQPDEALGYSNRSFSRLKLGDISGAKADIERSIEMYPANSYAYRTRALIAISERRKDDACEDLGRALELGFTDMYGPEVAELRKKHCR